MEKICLSAVFAFIWIRRGAINNQLYRMGTRGESALGKRHPGVKLVIIHDGVLPVNLTRDCSAIDLHVEVSVANVRPDKDLDQAARESPLDAVAGGSVPAMITRQVC